MTFVKCEFQMRKRHAYLPPGSRQTHPQLLEPPETDSTRRTRKSNKIPTIYAW